MRRFLIVFLVCGFVPAFLPALLRAQRAVPVYRERQPSFHIPPASPRKCVEIGNFYFQRKDYRGALSRYKQAARENRYYAPAYLGLGKAYEKMGKKHKALAAYRKYLAILPSERQAERATKVHKAIRRLKQQLQQERASASKAPDAAGKK